jgi:hypothetical protein
MENVEENQSNYSIDQIQNIEQNDLNDSVHTIQHIENNDLNHAFLGVLSPEKQ